ncbi:Cof-type HAD-IIB family hydrolase [Mammaliicoccus fleurettii]|uniref:Cof-type HAD-IIB family hydrolase n=1 Tax=Mammaliicoccus fleurettii TaxID=150056 RepID=UPI000991CC7C|nr:Cof-type HAD-IIB family hydrolase [Mammaliicoccus fleurettii]OOV78084.1 hydrolase Cof [Mammaliicoccus fleurettii]
MNKKLIFFDIDGTIYDEDKNIPKSTITAIKQLKEKGHIVAIATGRAPYMFKEVIKETGIETFVSLNGQIVVYNGEIIGKHPLDKEELTNIVEKAHTNNHPLVFFGETAVYANVESDNHISESLGSLKMDYPEYHNTYYLEHPVYQALIFHTEDEDDKYDDKFNSLKFYRWHTLSRDVVPNNRSKAEGIKELSEKLGFPLSVVVAFGDGPNDIEMISEVGQGVAMGNAVDALKTVCDYETKSVDEDGICYACKELGLIDE